MSESMTVQLTGDRGEDSIEDRVFSQCTHRRDNCKITQEAENVVVLLENKTPHHPQGLVHVWVYTYNNWSSCKTFSPSVWNALPMTDQLIDLRERLRFLKSMTQ